MNKKLIIVILICSFAIITSITVFHSYSTSIDSYRTGDVILFMNSQGKAQKGIIRSVEVFSDGRLWVQVSNQGNIADPEVKLKIFKWHGWNIDDMRKLNPEAYPFKPAKFVVDKPKK